MEGAEEIAERVKQLLHACEDLSLGPQPLGRCGSASVYHTNTGRAETGGCPELADQPF